MKEKRTAFSKYFAHRENHPKPICHRTLLLFTLVEHVLCVQSKHVHCTIVEKLCVIFKMLKSIKCSVSSFEKVNDDRTE